MKKLMIAFASVAVAMVAQAAAIDWSISNNSWTTQDGSRPAQGTTVYLINGATSLDVIAAAVADNTVSTSLDWVYGSAATDNGRGRVSELTTQGFTRGQSYDFSVLLIDKTSENGPYYMVSAKTSGVAYDTAMEDESLSIYFGTDQLGANAQTYNAASAANGWASAPEPTSGLLLLLGMAGLALKRKRA